MPPAACRLPSTHPTPRAQYGDGAIGFIDVDTHLRVNQSTDFKCLEHPESFQLSNADPDNRRIFVNIADEQLVQVGKRKE